MCVCYWLFLKLKKIIISIIFDILLKNYYICYVIILNLRLKINKGYNLLKLNEVILSWKKILEYRNLEGLFGFGDDGDW